MVDCLFLENDALYHSAIFSSHKGLLVGRVFKEGKHYNGLIIDENKKVGIIVEGGEDISLYSVRECKDKYVAVGHKGRRTFVIFYRRDSGDVLALIGPEGILWQTDCALAVGGYEKDGWQLLLFDIKRNRTLTFSSGENMYAYSFKKALKGYVVVGRVGWEGNYDGFVLWLDRNLKPLKTLRTNWGGNDYLRYTDVRWAVGRIEMKEDSEGLLIDLKSLKAFAYRRQGFDYFRYIHPTKNLIMGEAEDEDTVRKALVVYGHKGQLIGDGFSAIRFYDAKSKRAYGYMYMGKFAYAIRIKKPFGNTFFYNIQALRFRWRDYKLLPTKGSIGFEPIRISSFNVFYEWKDCEAIKGLKNFEED